MFKTIKTFFSKLVHTETAKHAGEGQRWAIWFRAPWYRPGSFSGRLGAIMLEVEDAKRYASRRAFAVKNGIKVGGRGFQLQIFLGNGPGYIWGRGLWLGRHLKGREGVAMYRTDGRVRFGAGRGCIPGWW